MKISRSPRKTIFAAVASLPASVIRPATVARFCLVTAGISLFSLSPRVAHAATITVNDAGDLIAANGVVTLREAITSIDNGADVNGDVTAARTGSYGASDAIHFAIGSGARTISPAFALPALLGTMTIDGSTQPGFVATPLITLDGTSAGAATNGLVISSQTSSTVVALSVKNFGGTGILVSAPAADATPPVAQPQSLSTPLDTPLPITLMASDPDNASFTFAIASGPGHGAISGFDTATGALTYTPTAGYTGPDSFTFTASDGTNVSSPATISITVGAPADTTTPVAQPQSLATALNTALPITLTATDPDDSSFTFAVVSGPSHGSISGFNAATGQLTYTPDTGYLGPDAFDFTASDGANTSAPATISIRVVAATAAAVPAVGPAGLAGFGALLAGIALFILRRPRARGLSKHSFIVLAVLLLPGALRAAVTLTGVIVSGNHRGGVLVAAGRADIGGATQIDGNHGGLPVAFGAQVAPGAVLTMTGAIDTPVQINTNDGIGLLVLGNFSGTFVEVGGNGIQGVWVDTTDAPLFPEGGTPVQNAVLSAFDIHGNGTNPGSFPPGGLTVLRTRTSTTSMTTILDTGTFYVPERFLLQEGPSIGTQSQVRDNLGDGVTLGGATAPSTGLCAILPPPLACGAVDGTVENSHIFGNQRGIVVQEIDADQNATVPVIFRNEIVLNMATGLYVHTSYVGEDPSGSRISGNVIGTNGWPGGETSCEISQTQFDTSVEVAPQVEFDGPVAALAAAATGCSAHTTSAVCNADTPHACIFNEAAAADKCRTSYFVGGEQCNDPGANTICGYHRLGTENEDFKVGIVVKDGAWVNAEYDIFAAAGIFAEGQDWAAIGSDSFASNGGTTCSAATPACPIPPPVAYPW